MTTTSAREATSHLADLLRREHHALAEFLVALAAFDARQGWSELEYASLFDYLHRELGLSKAAAFYRQTAARLVQRHTEVVEPLRDGRLCFSSVVELSKVLTPENLPEVLPRFFHLSKREAQEVRAELAPAPNFPRRAVVTAVPSAPVTVALALTEPSPLAQSLTVDRGQVVHPGEPAVPARSIVVEPKTAELSRIHLTVSRRLLAKLAAARDVLSHSHPGASEDEILELGLDLVLARYAKRRGLGAKPRKVAPKPGADGSGEAPPPTKRSRHVPAHVWRAVWKRDRGCCAWRLDGGGVCGSTHRLELDHVRGFALGAGTTFEECRLLCRQHQDVSARRLYGSELMNRYTSPKGGQCSEPVAVYGIVTRWPSPFPPGSDAGGGRALHASRGPRPRALPPPPALPRKRARAAGEDPRLHRAPRT